MRHWCVYVGDGAGCLVDCGRLGREGLRFCVGVARGLGIRLSGRFSVVMSVGFLTGLVGLSLFTGETSLSRRVLFRERFPGPSIFMGGRLLRGLLLWRLVRTLMGLKCGSGRLQLMTGT